jgi:hypothetical protein
MTLGTLNLGLTQARLDGADDAQRDLILKCEDVTERPIRRNRIFSQQTRPPNESD